MEPSAIERDLDELETRIERLRALYEQYFMGLEKLEPQIPRKEVDRRIQALRKEQIRNTALRFKFQMLIQRYNTLQQYWARVTREIESGTYRRDVMRAAARFGARDALTILGKKRAQQYAALADAQIKTKERERDHAGGGFEVELEAEELTDADVMSMRAPAHADEDEATLPLIMPEPASPGRSALLPPPARGAPPPPPPRASAPSAPVLDAGASAAGPRAPRWSGATPPLPARPAAGAPAEGRASAPPPLPGRGSVTQEGRSSVPPPLPVRAAPAPAEGRASTPPPLPGRGSVANEGRASAPPPLPVRAAPGPAEGRTSAPPPLPGRGSVVNEGRASAPPPLPGRGSVANEGRASALPPLPGRESVTNEGRASALPPLRGSMASDSKSPIRSADAASGGPGRPEVKRRLAELASAVRPPSPAVGLEAGRAGARSFETLDLDFDDKAASRREGSLAAPPQAREAPPPERAPVPPPRAPAVRPPAPAARAPVARPPSVSAPSGPSAGEGSLPDQRMRQIYAAYVETKRQANESTAGLTYEKLADTLRAQAQRIRTSHPTKSVDYEVVLKDGKTQLKPVLK